MATNSTPLPFVPFSPRGDSAAFMAALIRTGRTDLTLALTDDMRESVDAACTADDDGFWTYVERPLTAQMVQKSIVSHVAARIKRGELDAVDGPIITTGTIFRMDGELLPVRPSRQDSKGKTVESLAAVTVAPRAFVLGMLDATQRGLISFPIPADWTAAETNRASGGTPAVDAAPEVKNALTDGQKAAYVIEPKFSRRDQGICHGCQTRDAHISPPNHPYSYCFECATARDALLAPVQSPVTA